MEKWIRIPLLDLGRYNATVTDEWLKLARETALLAEILNGPHKRSFEKEFAEYLGVKHVLGVASGTDALVIALKSLGIGPGDEVITHANAFIACIEPIIDLGARPVLVDMSENDYGPDPDEVEAAVTKRTRAILAVHLCGIPADVSSLAQIAAKHGIPLVEDASQAQGAEYHGRKVGGLGVVNAFSLGPVKNLAALGDAGCIATDDDELYEWMLRYVVHGQVRKYQHARYGWNSRLDEVQAAWLCLGLKTLDERNTARRIIYDGYEDEFSDLPIRMMPNPPGTQRVFHQAIVSLPARDELREHLRERGIGTGVYYPQALHEQDAWKGMGFPEISLPRAEKHARENLALPVFPELTIGEIEYIIASVRSFFSSSFYRG